MVDGVYKDTKERMEKVLDALQREFNLIRTGRARPSLLDNIKADYYGAMTPLNQMAKISVPEARLLLIQPWDKSILGVVEKAILKSDLGLVPNNDGEVIRISIPQLTEERRKELVRLAGKKTEEQRISVRNIRRDANETLKKMEKESVISEDDYHRALDKIQELTNEYIELVDTMQKEKEQEIMEV